MQYTFYFLIAVWCLSVSDGQLFQLPKSQPNLEQRIVEWLEKEEISVNQPTVSQIVRLLYDVFHGLKSSEESTVPTAFYPNVSSECYTDSLAYLQGLRNYNLDALRMRETNGKFNFDVLNGGSIYAMGSFDECLALKYKVNVSIEAEVEQKVIRGRYCSVFYLPVGENDTTPIKPDNWATTEDDSHALRDNAITILEFIELLFKSKEIEPIEPVDGNFLLFYFPQFLGMGLCVPASCSADDVRQAITHLVGRHLVPNILPNIIPNEKMIGIVTATDDRFCYAEDDPKKPFDGPDIAVLVTLSLIAFLVVCATTREFVWMYLEIPMNPKTDSILLRALHCFSVINNSRKLLATSSSSDNLSCVHGIRVISTTWVIMGHTYFMLLFQPLISYTTITKDLQKWQFQTITNATVSVDTFFMLSGMLVAYLLLRELDRSKGKLNVLNFYLHRYLRLTPVYAIILGFLATLVVYTGTGPRWSTVDTYACRVSWWKNLLYINGYFTDNLCMGETWYLACDMQLFLLSPIFVYSLWYSRKLGLIVNFSGIIISLIAGIVLWTVQRYPMQVAGRDPTHDPPVGDYTINYYNDAGVRAPPYIWGILLGYVLHVTKNKPVELKKYVVAILWAVSFAIGLAVIYGLVPYLDAQAVPHINDFVRVSYGSLNRLAWAMAVSWVVFACVKGYGGIVNSILSWKAFGPLGRLTYCAYLIHLNFIGLYYAQGKEKIYYTTLNHIVEYFGILLFVFLLSFFVSVTVEAPFLNLEKLIFSPSSKRSNDKVKQVEPITIAAASTQGISNDTFTMEDGSLGLERLNLPTIQITSHKF